MEINKIYYKDCVIGLKDIEDKSIDHFYVDPPFDIDFNHKESMYNRNKSNVIKGYTEPNKISYYDFCLSWVKQLHRVLKDNGSGWICSGWSNLGDVLRAVDDCDFTVVNHVIWKYQFGVYTKRKFVTSHYHMIFIVKNKKDWYFNKDIRYSDNRDCKGNINYRDREDVWTIDRPYNHGKYKNANTQPIELVKKLYNIPPKKMTLY